MMGGFLLVFSVISCFFGVIIFAASKGAIHEIEAFVLFLISAVLFSAAAILIGFENVRTKNLEVHIKETNRLLSAILDNREKPNKAVSLFGED